MKILIASGAGGGTAKKSMGKIFHLKEFGEALKKNGVEYKLVREIDYISGFPSKDLKSWFSKKKFYKLIEEYKPDLVFVDRQSHFGLETIKAGIPLFVYLRKNPRGEHSELWHHVSGCRQWFKALRDTSTHEIIKTAKLTEEL